MIGRMIFKIRRVWDKLYTWRQFKGAQLDNVKLGPELNKRFEIRHPKNLVVGYKTVMSGDLFINAWGGYKLESIAISPKG